MMCSHFSIRRVRDRPYWTGWLFALALFVGAGSFAAHAQTADVETLIERGQQAGANSSQMRTVAKRASKAGLSSDVTASLLRPAVELAEQDLPSSPLLTKTLEGLTKRVPPARLQPVIQQLHTHTERAGQIVSQWMQQKPVREMMGLNEATPDNGERTNRHQLVTAMATAQQQNISAQHLDAFLNSLPSAVERRPVALSEVATAVSVMPDLPGSTSSPKATRQLLTAALNASYSPESLRQLPVALRMARRESQRPARALVRGTAQAIAQGTPATDVLQGLFQGSAPGGGPPAGVGNGSPGKGPSGGKPPGQGGNPPGQGKGKGPPNNPGHGGGPL